MRYMEDPRQSALFDVFEGILSPVAYRKLRSGWQHLFRCVILNLMPAKEMARHFDPAIGRPTKELYSMAGLVFVMEFRDWTHEEAADAYMYNVDLQYALNLRPDGQSMCRRTIERYIKLFRENDLAQQIMQDVTGELVKRLELDVSKQRLDSTHIESNMAKFGRIKLMATAIRRFLVQVQRHDEGSYKRLPRILRERYEASPNSVFGWKKLDDDEMDQVRQSVAEDLCYLVDRYRRNKKHHSRASYKMLVRVFEQQCEVVDDKVSLKKKTGGEIVCNPSDPDATFDGHKGSGYQVQLSETCSDQNDVQLILSTIPETACQSDSAALKTVAEDLKQQELAPDEMVADTAYGGDDNYQWCAKEGIDLISPTSGKCPEDHADPDAITTADFHVELREQTDEYGRREMVPTCISCPAGKEPHRSFYDSWLDQINILQFPKVCGKCHLRGKCPRRFASGWMQVTIQAKEVRLINRRRREQAPEFRAKYRLRSGIEATNSILKRVTGLDRVRVRGRPAVFSTILLKVAGWNILQTARVRSLLLKLIRPGGNAHSGQSSARFNSFNSLRDALQPRGETSQTGFHKFHAAAA